MNTIKKTKVSELLPNPNRNLKYYKLNPKRVDALIASFKASGEWPGIVVRERPDGRYEKAFGEKRRSPQESIWEG
jgi:ParB-like chromosome segregation protein Spo0J